MKVIDISWPISPEMTAYKDRKIVTFKSTKTFEKDGARETIITIGSHTGTHVDAPSHFLKDGKTIDQMLLEKVVGDCSLLDLSDVPEKITAEHLSMYDIAPDEIILLKTMNSDYPPTDPFLANFVYLDASAAQYLADCGVRAVGIDYLGIERNQEAHDTHMLLLQEDIPIIEGLRLAHAEEAYYSFICLPLALQGLDGAPARAILISDEDEE